MSTKTKIVVIRKKQLILSAAGICLILALVLLLAGFFRGSSSEDAAPTLEPESSSRYIPGVYTSTVVLNDSTLDVKVVLDENHINSVSLTNPDGTIETMAPLAEPAMKNLSSQILKKQSLDRISFSKDSTYTSEILYQGIKQALEKGTRVKNI